MSTRIVSSTMTILEDIIALPLPARRLRLDQPRNQNEAEVLAKFKKEIKGWNLHDEGKDDYFLLRFLRARGLNIPKAMEMLSKYLEYVETHKLLHEAMSNQYVMPIFIRENFPFLVSGADYDGRPVFVVQGGHAHLKALFDKGHKDDIWRLGHYALELVTHVERKARKKHGCTKVVLIADLNGFSFSNAFHVQTAQTAMYAAKVFEGFYPEVLHLAFAINANWIFTSLFNMMKHLLAEETIEKAQVFGHDASKWKPALKTHIPSESIPMEYGGTGPSFTSGSKVPFEHFKNERQNERA